MIILDTVETRFGLRHCVRTEVGNFTAFACPGEPTYILTEKCSDGYYLANGICCKFDESINFAKAAIDSGLLRHVKYFVQSDDDCYWRSDQLVRWLSAIDAAGVNQVPFVANGQVTASSREVLSISRAYGGRLWHFKDGCKEIKTNGWYQPMAMNRLALEVMSVGTRDYGVTSTCKAFEMSQDSGLGVYFWLFQLYHIYMPGVNINSGRKGTPAFQEDCMVIHTVQHQYEEECDPVKWPAHLRHDQDYLIGCGTLERMPPNHDSEKLADMYDAWNFYLHRGGDITLGVKDVNDWIEVQGQVDATGKLVYDYANNMMMVEYKHAHEKSLTNSYRRLIMSSLDGLVESLGLSSYFHSHKESDGVTRTLRRQLVTNETTPTLSFNSSQSSAMVIPHMAPLLGYEYSNHAKVNNIQMKWHEFTPKDCIVPGIIDK